MKEKTINIKNHFLLKIAKIVNKNFVFITNYFFLNIIYFFGIGISSIIAKLTGKNLLKMRALKTTWHKHPKIKESELNLMY